MLTRRTSTDQPANQINPNWTSTQRALPLQVIPVQLSGGEPTVVVTNPWSGGFVSDAKHVIRSAVQIAEDFIPDTRHSKGRDFYAAAASGMTQQDYVATKYGYTGKVAQKNSLFNFSSYIKLPSGLFAGRR